MEGKSDVRRLKPALFVKEAFDVSGFGVFAPCDAHTMILHVLFIPLSEPNCFNLY